MGPDIVIVTTNCPHQAKYWDEKLKDAIVVHEDWPGGAGNGLGTLYAFQKAGVLEELRAGKSVFLYHTAGKGTRLAPLPASEGNNKSAVRLPHSTLLEAVIEQTAPLAENLGGRLTVFWGDQLFFPSQELRKPVADVEVFAKGAQAPTREELERYGIWFGAKLYEKPGLETYEKLKGDGVGISLGSFTLSQKLLEALLEEFAVELGERRGKLDTDPDFWMPLCGMRESARMEKMKWATVGTLDVGAKAKWLDYGNLQSYYRNCLREAPLMIDCEIEEADVQNSVLVGVKAKRVKVRDAVLIDVSAPEIEGEECLLYNVHDERSITMPKGTARADAMNMAFYNSLHGGNWSDAIEGNPVSFDELYELVRLSQPESVTT